MVYTKLYLIYIAETLSRKFCQDQNVRPSDVINKKITQVTEDVLDYHKLLAFFEMLPYPKGLKWIRPICDLFRFIRNGIYGDD